MVEKYKEKTEQINTMSFDVSDLCGRIDDIIKTLEDLKDTTKKLGYYNIEISYEWFRHEYEMILKGTRQETDKERDKRLQDYRKNREKQILLRQKKKDKEHAQYLKLKEKFENVEHNE